MTQVVDSSGEPKRSMMGWLIVAVVAVALVAGALVMKREKGAAPTAAATGVDALAAVVPSDALVFLAVDLRQQWPAAKLLDALRELEKQSPALSRSVEDMEKEGGFKLEEVAKWWASAGCIAFTPSAGQKGFTLPTSSEQPPFELVIALSVTDEGAARAFIEHRLKKDASSPRESEREGVKLWIWSGSSNKMELGFAIEHGHLFVGTASRVIAAVKAAAGKGPALAGQPQFVEARQRASGPFNLFIYAAVSDAFAPLLSASMQSAQVDQRTLEGLKALPYVVLANDFTSDHGSVAYMKVDPSSKSDFAKALLSPTPLTAPLTRLFPRAWGGYTALNVKYAGAVLYQLAMLLPEPRSKIDMGLAMMGLQLGFDPLGEFVKASDGDVAWSADMTQGLGEGSAQKPGATAASQSFLVAVSIKDKAVAEALIGKIEQKAHLSSRVVDTVDGVAVHGYDRVPVLWATVTKPASALLLAIGPRSSILLKAGLGSAAAAPAESVEGVAELEALRKAADGRAEMASYLELKPVIAAIIDAVKTLPSRGDASSDAMRAAFLRTLEGMRALRAMSVVSVEKDGVAVHSRGPGLDAFAVGSVVAAILVPNFVRARGQGQATACKSNLKNIGTALEMYSTDHDGHFPSSLSQLVPSYLKWVPTCPSAGKDTYSPSFQASARPDAYTVICGGHNHGGAGLSPTYPQYTSFQGLLER